MEEFLHGLINNNSAPVFTAFILGLMTAISPCPMATNITAIGFISKDMEDRKKVFYNGLIYTAGRGVAYTLLALVIYFGADQMEISGWFQKYGEKFIGPLLIFIGLIMLDVLKIKLPGIVNPAKRFQEKTKHSFLDVFLLGFMFALAFCPYSGVIYFMTLIPLTVTSASGLYLPVVFAIATGIPVILFAWLIAHTVSGVGKAYNKLKAFEFWFRKVISILFIGVGIYYVIIVYF